MKPCMTSNNQAMPFLIFQRWKIGPWSGCSRTCGGGVETRTVSCVRESVTGVQYMNQDFCPESPALHRSCNTDQCPRWQIMTDWSEVCLLLFIVVC